MNKEEFSSHAWQASQTLYRVASAYLSCPADREDAVQETLLRAWEKRNSLREEQYFKTWLTRILIRICVDMQRRKKRVTVTDAFPEQAAPAPPDPALREAIDALDTSLRIVIVLYYLEGYDTRDVAFLLRISQGTVKSRLFRARKQLKAILKEDREL